MDKELQGAVEEVFKDFCPEGDNCPVHFRVDRETLHEEEKFGSSVTYVGNYAVMTGDNMNVTGEMVKEIVLFAITGKEPEDFPYYEVCVVEVGDATLADIQKRVEKEGDHFTRYVHTFNKWEDFSSEHAKVVRQVADGTLDLTKYPNK